MNKKIFFILLINYFIPVTYAEPAAQEGQTSMLSMLKSMNFNQKTQKSLYDQTNENDPLDGRLQAEKPLERKPSYLSPTQSSKASKESPEKEWSNSLRSDNPTAAKNNRGKKEKSDNKKTPVPNVSTKGPVKSEVSKPNSNVSLENQKIEKEKGIVLDEPSVSDNQTKAKAYLKDLLAEESPVTNFLKEAPVKNVSLENVNITNQKEELLKKIIQLNQDIVDIENQMIKFEHYDIKEKMNASELEDLKKPMKEFKDEKIEEKKKLETEFRNLEEKILEKNFGKELISQLGKKIQEDVLRDKKYEKEISMLKKEQEKKEKEQKSQKEQASKKGFSSSIKSFFKS
jgi:hypothetical protein